MNGFPKKVRLITAPQFKQIFNREKEKVSTSAFNIFYCENSLAYPRVGVIIPKKNINKATERNRFKRIVRECFRLNQTELKSLDILVLIKKQAEGLTKQELNKSLEQHLKKLSL